MRTTLPVASALLCALLLSACGPSNGDEDGGVVSSPDAGHEEPDAGHTPADGGEPDAGPVDAGFTHVDPEDWCQAKATAFCGRAKRCLLVTDAEWDVCLHRQLESCNQPAYAAGVAQGRLSWDPKAALDCLNGYAHSACAVAPEACDAVFTGTVTADNGCLLEEECGPGTYCLTWESTCPFTCYGYRALNETCNSWDQQCDPDEAACVNVNGTSRCVARQDEGAACVNWSDCKAGLACVSNQCVKTEAKVGEVCREVQGYPYCETDSFCRQDPAPPGGQAPPGVCMKKAGLGGVCSGYGTCLTGLRCSSNYATGTCVPLAGEGERCTNYNDCRLELYCHTRTATCLPVPEADGDCSNEGSSYRCAPGYYCYSTTDEATCLPLKPLGEACSWDGMCQSQDCGMGVLNDGGMGYGCLESCAVRWDGGM